MSTTSTTNELSTANALNTANTTALTRRTNQRTNMKPSTIPTLHFIWFDRRKRINHQPQGPLFPSKVKEIVQTAHRLMPKCPLLIWSESDCLSFVQREYPQQLKFYQSLRFWIQQVDYAKYLIMHKHGGFYLDTDYETKRDLMPLWTTYDLVLPGEFHQGGISNFFFMSKPGHPFWLYVLDYCHQNVKIFEHSLYRFYLHYAFESGFWYFKNRIPFTPTSEELRLRSVQQPDSSKYVLFASGPFAVQQAYERYTTALRMDERIQRTTPPSTVSLSCSSSSVAVSASSGTASASALESSSFSVHVLRPNQSGVSSLNFVLGTSSWVLPSDAYGIHHAVNDWLPGDRTVPVNIRRAIIGGLLLLILFLLFLCARGLIRFAHFAF